MQPAIPGLRDKLLLVQSSSLVHNNNFQFNFSSLAAVCQAAKKRQLHRQRENILLNL
jgi:hypothetical protein